MKKLSSTLPNMVISLVLVTALSGAVLGAVYSLTKDPIALSAAAQQKAAIADVAPAFTNDPEADKVEFSVDGCPVTVYPAISGDRLEGAAVKASSMDGFAGEVVVMVGFDADGTVRDYRVLSQAETPGLGAKMEAWFRDPAGARSVLGKNPASYSFFVTKDQASHGQVDAITAATISSRAFLGIVRRAYAVYAEYAAAQGLSVAPLLNDNISVSK